MGLRFRKSFKIAPGLRVNLTKTGIGLSAGGKGIRYSVHSSGRRTKTVGIPGTGLYYTETSLGKRNYNSSAYQRRNELASQQQDAEKLEKLEQNRLEVELFENQIKLLTSIHKECDEEFHWQELKDTPPPFEKGEKGPRELKAIKKYQEYNPSFFKKIFNQDEKEKEQLLSDIQSAKREDQEEYQSWDRMVSIAKRISDGDVDAYLEAIEDLDPLGDLVDFGSEFEFFIEDPRFIEVEFDVKTENTIPKEVKSLTKTGRVSTKQWTKTKYYALQQDYVCSTMLRIARDMFAILPIDAIYIHAFDDRLDTTRGNWERVTILSIKMNRETLNGLNFDLIDCSDAMNNFQHNMIFKKTKGFYPVEKLEI